MHCPLFVSIDSFGSLPAAPDSSAFSMVATPHWGDCFLSNDLTADESPATGSRQRFVHRASASLAPRRFSVIRLHLRIHPQFLSPALQFLPRLFPGQDPRRGKPGNRSRGGTGILRLMPKYIQK